MSNKLKSRKLAKIRRSLKYKVSSNTPPSESYSLLYRMEVNIAFGLDKEVKTYGPFCAGIYDKKYEHACNLYRHNFRGCPKEPSEEGLEFYSGMVCGTKDSETMLRWISFRETYDNLYKAGFRLNVYKVLDDKVQHDKTQSVWHPEDAEFIREATYGELTEAHWLNVGSRLRSIIK